MKPVLAVFCAGFLAACAQPPEKADTRSRTVTAGQSVLLDNFGFWNRDCQTKAFDLNITQQPANGTLTTRDATWTIPKKPGIGSSDGCVGKSVASKEVLYTPNAGYQGADAVGLTVGNERGAKAFLYKVTVN